MTYFELSSEGSVGLRKGDPTCAFNSLTFTGLTFLSVDLDLISREEISVFAFNAFDFSGLIFLLLCNLDLTMDQPNMNKSEKDLLFDILSRLPAKPLIRFMSVSKSWFHLISKDSCFILHHLRFQRASTDALLFLPSLTESRIRNAPVHYLSLGTSEHRKIRPPWSRPGLRRRMKVYNSYSDLSIAGHCNGGLVCVSDAHRLIIWNPAIRRFKILPETDDFNLQLQSKNEYGRQSEVQTVIGFGFAGNHESCYYKVVRMTYTNEDASMSRLDHPSIGEVFDSRTDSWRRVADEDVQRLSITRRASNGAFVGESLYWLGERSKTLEEEEASGSDFPYYYPKLTAMSLVDEKTRSVELPGEFDMEIDSGRGVAALGGSKLGLFSGDHRHRLLVTVWGTEVDQVCWVKLFRVNLQAEPLCFSGNGGVVMRMRYRGLVLFDPEICDPCHFVDLGFDIADHAVGYAESLLLLDGERGEEEEEPNNAEETEVEEEDSFEGFFDLFD